VVTVRERARLVTDPASRFERPADDPAFAPLWRGVDIFRVAALIYAAVVYATSADDMRLPLAGWVVIAVMTAWTVFLTVHRARPIWIRVADLTLAVAAVLASIPIQGPELIADGAPTIPSFWAATAVLTWAVGWGWRGGLVSASLIGVADIAVVKTPSSVTIHNLVLLILAGAIVGYAVTLFRMGQGRLDQAVALEAATRERERLARDIHDSVLQVLAYVKRRGQEVGGEAAEIARLAGEQETRLRSLILSGPPPDPWLDGAEGDGHHVDVRRGLVALASNGLTVSGPADPVVLPRPAAEALTAAVREAVANVHRHAGESAAAWVLLEDEGDAVVVSVRDDGAGIPAGRLEQAAADGRIGVRSSIRGRIADVGGVVAIVSAPGQGTEVEMRVPKVMPT
jgi:signal transduction histidine kinase